MDHWRYQLLGKRFFEMLEMLEMLGSKGQQFDEESVTFFDTFSLMIEGIEAHCPTQTMYFC